MKKSRSDAIYDAKKELASFAGCECCEEEETLDVKEYDKSIAEIQCMIDYFIGMENTEEVSFWRRMLQETKIAKRRAKMRNANINRMEIAYT